MKKLWFYFFNISATLTCENASKTRIQ